VSATPAVINGLIAICEVPPLGLSRRSQAALTCDGCENLEEPEEYYDAVCRRASATGRQY
jgi:hypothetical protein